MLAIPDGNLSVQIIYKKLYTNIEHCSIVQSHSQYVMDLKEIMLIDERNFDLNMKKKVFLPTYNLQFNIFHTICL